MKLNNKGFTLIEILAVIVILSVLSGVAVVGVVSTINNGKKKSYEVMIGNIASASDVLYREVENGYLTGSVLMNYDLSGDALDPITIDSGVIDINLQTLVSNGFLSGINNNCHSSNDDACNNGNGKVLLNPKDSSDLGDCSILITKCGVTTLNDNDLCPVTSDFSKYFNGRFVFSNDDILVNDGLKKDIFSSGGILLGKSFEFIDNSFVLKNTTTVTIDNYLSLSGEYKYGCFNDSCDSYYVVDWNNIEDDTEDSNLYAYVDVYTRNKKVICD